MLGSDLVDSPIAELYLFVYVDRDIGELVHGSSPNKK